MDSEEFRRCGREMVDYIADYIDGLRTRLPQPGVQPGYMREMLPRDAPLEGHTWDDVKKDLEAVVMQGALHWQSPHFHGFVPIAMSYPGLLGEMLSSALAGSPFSWEANPSNTELEVQMMDWLARMLKLPENFLFSSGGPGGGVILNTADDAVLVAMLSARAKAMRQMGSMTKGEALDKLVAYASVEVHSSVVKAAQLALVTMRLLPSDEKYCLRGAALAKAVKEDKEKGLVPFFVCGTLGTTSTCSNDNFSEIGPICEEEDLWFHIDAAYSGSACICPEYRPLLNGVEYATTFNFNPHKWLQVNRLCSALWVKDANLITEAMSIDAYYLRNHDDSKVSMPDFRNWQIQLTRNFSSIKMWFVLRMFGVKGLQECIRRDVRLAKQFETLVREDSRFEIFSDVVMAIVCFRLKADNETNRQLLRGIDKSRKLLLTPTEVRGTYILRFAIAGRGTNENDIIYAWNTIKEQADSLLTEINLTEVITKG